jgi:CheY-like chemotaxis protein
MARETILVLDPEPIVSSVIRSILEREGYRVSTANTVEQALPVVDGNPPDLLLTNIYIPGTTGHDAAKFLKEKCPEMRVLMVTACRMKMLSAVAQTRPTTSGFPNRFKPVSWWQKSGSS